MKDKHRRHKADLVQLRIIECFRLKGTSGDHLFQPLFREKSAITGYSGPCQGELSVSPRLENPQPFWAILPVFNDSHGDFIFHSIQTEFSLLQLGTLSPCLLAALPWQKLDSVFSISPLYAAEDLNKILPLPSDPNTEQSQMPQPVCTGHPPSTVLAPLHAHLSCTREPKTASVLQMQSHQGWRREEDNHFSWCDG